MQPPNCYQRKCKWFKGVKNNKCCCEAFPDGIPEDISYGSNMHRVPEADQVGRYTFEKRSTERRIGDRRSF
jgi:hypothetical protein